MIEHRLNHEVAPNGEDDSRAESGAKDSDREVKRPRRSWERELAAFGWTRDDVQEFYATFARVGPYAESPPGEKAYRRAHRYVGLHRMSRELTTTIVRKHLLGEIDVAVMHPILQIRSLAFDFDDDLNLHCFLDRLGRFKVQWAQEASPRGGGHLFVPVRGDLDETRWAPVTKQLVSAVLADRVDSLNLSDIVRIGSDQVLRLPMTLGRTIEFSDGVKIDLIDPSDSLQAWRHWNTLTRHGIEKMQKLAERRYRRPGRPRTRNPSEESYSIYQVPPVPIRRQAPDFSVICTDSPAHGRSQVSAGNPANAMSPEAARVLKMFGSLKNRRHTTAREVVWRLLDLGVPRDRLIEDAFAVLQAAGSKDANDDPERTRRNLERRTIPWAIDKYKPRRFAS